MLPIVAANAARTTLISVSSLTILACGNPKILEIFRRD
jgi:hypothetical protein